MTQHDYKAALDEMKSLSGYCPDHFDESPNCQQDCALFIRERMDTIIHALKIADKLMQEPSDNAIRAGHAVYDCSPSIIFKAMRDQMLREVE